MPHGPGRSSLWVVDSSAEAGFILLLMIQEDQQASPPSLKGSPQLPAVEKNAEETVGCTPPSAITRTPRERRRGPIKSLQVARAKAATVSVWLLRTGALGIHLKVTLG